MRTPALRIYLGAVVDEETARDYIANALYVLATEQRMDKSSPRLADILGRSEKKDDRTGDEILNDITDKLKARAKGRRNTDGSGD